MKKTVLIFSVCGLLFVSSNVWAKSIYVSQNGNDYGNGTIEQPYKTVERANIAVECMNENGTYPFEGVEIVICDNEYFVDDTVKLTKFSGGTKDAPVVYKGMDETILYSSRKVIFYDTDAPSSSVLLKIPGDARNKICEIDISDLGIKNADDIKMLYSGEEAMTKSRWPNNVYYMPYKIYDSGSATSLAYSENRNFIIGYDDPRFENWTGIENIRIKGFPRYLWSFSDVGVTSIGEGKIESDGSASYGLMNGAKLWFENVLEELDEPGEWYLDVLQQKIYFYPKYEYNHEIGIVYNSNDMFDIQNASNITFENIKFEGGANSAITVKLSDNILVKDCEFSFFAQKPLNMQVCNNSGVRNSVFSNLSAGAINIGGGEQSNLTNGLNYVENCEIFEYDLINPVSQAINIYGVGNRISNNSIHDAFHGAITINGNNNIIENNEIYNVLMGTDDAGAIYMYANSTYRGNIIRNNYFHHLGTGGERYSQTGIAAVYFDGFTSNQTLEKNIFYDCNIGLHVNGGGYIKALNNVFVDVQAPFNVHRSDLSTVTYWSRLYDIYFNKDIWYEQYPELKTHYSESAYVGNLLDNNLAFDCGENRVTGDIKSVVLSDFQVLETDVFEDINQLDFEISEKEKILEVISDFEFYDFSDIGRK